MTTPTLPSVHFLLLLLLLIMWVPGPDDEIANQIHFPHLALLSIHIWDHDDPPLVVQVVLNFCSLLASGLYISSHGKTMWFPSSYPSPDNLHSSPSSSQISRSQPLRSPLPFRQ